MLWKHPIDLYLNIAAINGMNVYLFLMFDFLMTLKALLFPHIVVLPFQFDCCMQMDLLDFIIFFQYHVCAA